MKKLIVNNTVKALNKLALNSVGIACAYLVHQPKEPKSLTKMIKK